MGLVSQTVKQYFDAMKDNANTISITLPMAFLPKRSNFQQAALSNSFISVTAYLGLDGDINQAVLKARRSLLPYLNKI
jgi:hypothetical protein